MGGIGAGGGGLLGGMFSGGGGAAAANPVASGAGMAAAAKPEFSPFGGMMEGGTPTAAAQQFMDAQGQGAMVGGQGDDAVMDTSQGGGMDRPDLVDSAKASGYEQEGAFNVGGKPIDAPVSGQLPENYTEMFRDLEGAGVDPRTMAAMLGMAQFEFPNLPNEPGAYHSATGGAGGNMQGALQTNTNYFDGLDTSDKYIAQQRQFFGEGRTPSSKGRFDVDKFWEAFEAGAADGIQAKDMYDAYKAGGFTGTDYHPLIVPEAVNRMSDDTAKFLYEYGNRGRGPISIQEWKGM